MHLPITSHCFLNITLIRIISPAATTKQIYSTGTPDWECGYGFQFWMCRPEGVYRGDGKNGQYCIVMPRQDAVVAITSHEEKNLQGILDCVWEEILPQL